VFRLARELAPSLVVLEDVDLVGEERTMMPAAAGPVLFELLNELDGIGDDADVAVVLTTNRADLLEPALAARPGRVDLAELPLPDAASRRRLLDLYARGLPLDPSGIPTRSSNARRASPPRSSASCSGRRRSRQPTTIRRRSATSMSRRRSSGCSSRRTRSRGSCSVPRARETTPCASSTRERGWLSRARPSRRNGDARSG